MIQAEADDLAVMWGGTDEAKAKAQAWLATRESEMGSAATGAPDEAASVPDVFEVDWDNVSAARIFMGLVTQWRVTAMSGMAGGIRIKEGLDYNAMPVVAGALGVMLDADVLDGIQKLERVTMGLEAARATSPAGKAARASKSSFSATGGRS